MKNIFASLSGKLRGLSPKRRGLVFFFALFAGLLLIGRVTRRSATQEVHKVGGFRESVGLQEAASDGDLREEWQRMKDPARQVPAASVAVKNESASVDGLIEVPSNGGPLIAHAAVLAVTTKDFSHSRATLEEVLERHHGYASKLRMTGQSNGSTLTATLRVPSSEFGSTVTDLKVLGTVQKEEQTADEITQQRADLEARLANAQNSLRRLQEILAKTKPWDNRAEVQRQLMNVRAEVTRLQAERIASENRTVFANVLFSMREEIATPVETFGAQFHKAALAGISDALSNVSGIVLFGISYGPGFLVWTVLLFFPSRWMWRKWRQLPQAGTAQTAQGS